MKKIFYFTALLVMAVGCNGKGDGQKNEAQIADSIAQAEAREQARIDSIRQDSIAKAEELANAAAQYDNLLKQYEDAVVAYQKFVKNFNGNYSKQPAYTTKCIDLYKQLNKVKDQLTDEQKKKFKSLSSKYDKAFYSIQG